MANLLKVKWEEPSTLRFIPTLLEQKPDGIYVCAFCPLCDMAEKSKMENPGQPRDESASVARIRWHLRTWHRNRKAAL